MYNVMKIYPNGVVASNNVNLHVHKGDFISGRPQRSRQDNPGQAYFPGGDTDAEGRLSATMKAGSTIITINRVGYYLREAFVSIKIRSLPGVAEVEFIPKEQALAKLEESIGADKLEGLDFNPLPDAFRVKVSDPQLVPRLAGEITGLRGVEQVRYGQGLVEKLLAVTRGIRIAGWVTMVVLGCAAIFLISTTIRVSVFSRRHEIGIMKLLGATNWFIRFPFLLEGLFLGLGGGLIASAGIFYGYLFVVRQINAFLPFLPLVNQLNEIFFVFFSLLGLGLAIGAAGSVFSVRRFLNV
jgi:cell division transport system permease protein